MIPRRFRRGSRDAFFHLRLLLAVALCSAALLLGLFAVNAGGAVGDAVSVPGTKLLPLQKTQTRSAALTKISPWVFNRTANGQQAEFLVVLADKADLSQAKTAGAKHERRRQIRDALWTKAQQTQQPIVQWLRERQIEHRAFYIVNAILVKADARVAAALAERPDVLRIEGNPEVRNKISQGTAAIVTPATPEVTPTPEPGIVYSHAPQVWSLGYTGQGIVVAGADTGIRWTHQALKNHYRGWDGTTANHDYNWHDSVHTNGGSNCGNSSTTPCDGDVDAGGHGTHTMGTAVGSDGGNNLIGMAPGAQWIGCRNMDPHGNGTPARYIECMEFFLAPYPVGGTPAQGNPDLAPDISTNSWSCPQSEGCTSADTLQAAVEAQRAAGIFMVAAAGNDGPTCGSISDPPGIYEEIYTIGALSTGLDSAAGFSSRGPVGVDQSFRIKPDLAAPGTNVRSAFNSSNIAYGKLDGTSMATPHVAGAVALLWSAVPILRNNITATLKLLNDSAVPIGSIDGCGANGIPNDTYGNGRLDVKAAVDYGLLETTPLKIVRNPDTSMTFTFYGAAGRTYRLERRETWDPNGGWYQAAGVDDVTVNSNGLNQVTDPNASWYPFHFYRVRVLP